MKLRSLRTTLIIIFNILVDNSVGANFIYYIIIQELINEVDQDGNGVISFNEFVWLMTRSGYIKISK